jgi:hypothetical protein
VSANNSQASASYRSTWAYRESFHGFATLADPVSNLHGRRPYRPRPIVRNARLMPPVFFFSISLVVNEEVGRELARFDGVDLSPCKWQAVCDLPVDERGVTEMVERFDILNDGFSQWLEGRLRPPDARTARTVYLEVVAPAIETLAGSFACDRQVHVPEVVSAKPRLVPTCARIHELHPVVKAAPAYLLAQPAYSVLEPHVADPELFTVESFDLRN